jgi:hypothetical protein
MTIQTFDPYGSLDLPDMLDQAKLKLVWHPFWKSIKGTPLENDLPVLMVELTNEYLKRQKKKIEDIENAMVAMSDSLGIMANTTEPTGD